MGVSRESHMPAATVVVLTVVFAMFGLFMVVLGSVWIWTNLPERAPQKVARVEREPAFEYRKAA